MNNEAYRFFLRIVDLEKKRVKYYNGDKTLLWECMGKEKSLREYINSKLAVMREVGMEDVPEDIPERITRK